MTIGLIVLICSAAFLIGIFVVKLFTGSVRTVFIINFEDFSISGILAIIAVIGIITGSVLHILGI